MILIVIIFLHVQNAQQEISDFKVDLSQVRDVWRFAMRMSGEQCVTTSGALWMQQLHADSLDILEEVCKTSLLNM